MCGADCELLGGIGDAFALDDQEVECLGGVGLLLACLIEPGAEAEGAVVLALDGGRGCPQVATVEGGASGDALAVDGFCEVGADEALEGAALAF